MVQSSERISLWWAVMGSRVNAAGPVEDKKRETTLETVLAQRVSILFSFSFNTVETKQPAKTQGRS